MSLSIVGGIDPHIDLILKQFQLPLTWVRKVF